MKGLFTIFLGKGHQKPKVILKAFDDFKKISDQYGHLVGDQVLIAFSNLLIANFEKLKFASRYGGGEIYGFL